jgi:hypothetical protein
MQTIRNTVAAFLLFAGALAIVLVGPAMGMDPGVWIVLGGLLSIGLAALIADA